MNLNWKKSYNSLSAPIRSFQVILGIHTSRVCWDLNLVISLEALSVYWWAKESLRIRFFSACFTKSEKGLSLLIMEDGYIWGVSQNLPICSDYTFRSLL